MIETINSGNEEPIERIVKPANPSEIPNTLDISTVESTANLPPAPMSSNPSTNSNGRTLILRPILCPVSFFFSLKYTITK